MLGREYISINGTKIPNPASLTMSAEDIETTAQSEGGYDLVNIVRLGKLKATANMDLTSWWADKMEVFCQLPQCQLKIGNRTYRARLRGFSKSLVEDSEYVNGTNGLWKVSFNITEF